ncbi:MAG: Hsp20/alpha crystallin family protein [Gammaproteobacteria bacterium]|nr:Hsp20/alpha crystallin family protein [Gammaproteobacteria bacterium]NNM20803.1 Hsp20/alpha crystallin family protein [Gammaproteobacteria bacterium]
MGKEIGVKRALTPFAHSMEDLFENFLPRRWMGGMDPFIGKRPWAEFEGMLDRTDMRFDILDRDHDLAIRVELPGVKKEDINISIAGDYLTVEAERVFKEEEVENYFRSELGTGKLIRTILLPVEVEPEKVMAVLKDGILEIELPKAKPEKRHVVKVA